jgi:guanylate kinase
MAARDTTEPLDGRGPTPSNKRKFQQTYDPTMNEQFPQDPWHTLNHEVVVDQVGEMCDEFTIPLENYADVDEAIANLKRQAEDMKKLPDMKKLNVAVLGEQGIGKSTLVNALLDRKILEKSGGSTACTAYATRIEHKKDAVDGTQMSDVKIEFFSDEEIEAFVKDQINRWADCYAGPSVNQQHDNHGSDSDESVSETQANDRPKANGVDKTRLRQAAKTAKEFFCIVYNTKNNAQQRQCLNRVLQDTDIREGDFRQRCFAQAKTRLSEIATRLHAQNGISINKDVSDRSLVQARNIIKEIWPFVKVVTIATGHVLLRYGICFLDLPGKSSDHLYMFTPCLLEKVMETRVNFVTPWSTLFVTRRIMRSLSHPIRVCRQALKMTAIFIDHWQRAPIGQCLS